MQDKKIDERLFLPSGPLGSFSAKIDLAYISGLITKSAHSDLVRVKEIRNAFAHNLEIKDFQSNKIRDNVKNLTLINSHIKNFEDKPGAFVLAMDTKAMPRMAVRDYNGVRKRSKASIPDYSGSLHVVAHARRGS